MSSESRSTTPTIVERITATGVTAGVAALRRLPYPVLYRSVRGIARAALWFGQRHREVAHINLRLAFPEQTGAWRDQVLRQSLDAFARLTADAIRVPRLSREWVREHVEFPREQEFRALHEGASTGVLIATGHLGSFELFARSAALLGYPLSFVVRDFKNPELNRWWKGVRELGGNRMISRRGAYREVVRDLTSGRDVALLFDQNVTRNHAVFVDFFGRPAATTKAVALAALQTEAPVVVASLGYLGEDRYRIDWNVCHLEDVLRSEQPRAEKIREITQRVSRDYEAMIRRRPQEWFWIHRRWKTTESPDDPGLYPKRPKRAPIQNRVPESV